MTWQYQGQPLTEAPSDRQGFVYIIHDLPNDMWYIGKKNFWRTVKRPPLKGKRNKRHSRVETDWQSYYGSSERLKLMVDAFGKSQFEREILVMCNTKTQMSYEEVRLQIEQDVLFRDDYYNDYIGCRITSRGLQDTSFTGL